LKQSSQEQAFSKLDSLGNRQVDLLRKLTKKVEEARNDQDDQVIRNSIDEYDSCIEKYVFENNTLLDIFRY